MKILKFFAWLILIVVTLILVVPLFLPSSVSVSQSVNIKSDKVLIFRQINNLRNWSNWSPWKSDNPNSISVFSGPFSGAGSSHHWESEQMGKGSITITESYPYDSLVSRLDFGNRGSAHDHWTISDSGDSVMVRWTFLADSLTYPIGKLNAWVMQWMIRPYQRDGLFHLKQYCEERQEVLAVRDTLLAMQPALYLDDSCDKDSLYPFIIEGFRKLIAETGFVEEHMEGWPFVLYLDHPLEEKVRFRLAIPVKEDFADNNPQVFYHDGGHARHANFNGRLAELAAVHSGMIDYHIENKLELLPPWEVWQFSPFQLSDSVSGNFRLCYPIIP